MPFESFYNWDPHTVDSVIQQIEHAHDTGAAGIFLRRLYHFTACDCNRESVGGYGVQPRGECLDAIRKWSHES